MGEVYRARDPRLGRDVAVKILPGAFSAHVDRLHRFEQEARAAAARSHPNILAVYDIGTDGKAPFIVSELLEGETLRERLNAGPVAVRKAIQLALSIAHGLAAAHEKGITHRDLKPENVFVTSDNRERCRAIYGRAELDCKREEVTRLSRILPCVHLFNWLRPSASACSSPSLRQVSLNAALRRRPRRPVLRPTRRRALSPLRRRS
jgi:serine/threonine protein kinase